MRGAELSVSTKLITEECCACGTTFAMTAEFRRQRLEDRRSFYCPAGHGQNYTGKTEAEKLREQLDSVKASRDFWQKEHDRERAKHTATKGQLTKTKKRAANGVCPCCKRTFANVARHVATQHPQFLEETNDKGATT